MDTKQHPRGERCETCRFWDSVATECHRHAPVVPPPNQPEPESAAGVWPRTPLDGWCGEWAIATETASRQPAAPCDEVATSLFLGRLAPALETRNPAALVESLLNQLPPDVRRVIVRMNGLDNQPLAGLKDVAREFRMSQGQVRALLAAGEERLAEAVRGLSARLHEQK